MGQNEIVERKQRYTEMDLGLLYWNPATRHVGLGAKRIVASSMDLKSNKMSPADSTQAVCMEADSTSTMTSRNLEMNDDFKWDLKQSMEANPKLSAGLESPDSDFYDGNKTKTNICPSSGSKRQIDIWMGKMEL
ncbi:hypothetical protein OPT61_g2977 [Boeremia exigua]|uniref:Uncharacterized protein n=1 Tax=Boeremia exigua TaxID=749465 RepID=A0ACC2IJU5_9PLEO|nr:hypothetical protein OPT61_g2977 [Boeremia exigua]